MSQIHQEHAKDPEVVTESEVSHSEFAKRLVNQVFVCEASAMGGLVALDDDK